MAPGGGFSDSEFELNHESRGGILSLWCRSSRSHFRGMEETLSLNGDARTTMIGADHARGPLTVACRPAERRLGRLPRPEWRADEHVDDRFLPVGGQVNDWVRVLGGPATAPVR